MLYWRRSDNGSAIFFTHSRSVRTRSFPGSSRFPIFPTVPTADPRNAIKAHIFSRSTTSFAEFNVSTCVFLLIRSSIDLTFCGIFVCSPLQFKCQFISYFGAVGLLYIRYAVHFCVVLPMFLRLVLSILYFFAKNQRNT